METKSSEKRTFQRLLLKMPGQFGGPSYKDCDDEDSIHSPSSENRSSKKSTLYGRTNFSHSLSPTKSSYAEIESTESAQDSRYDLDTQDEQENPQEPLPESGKQDSQKQPSDKQKQKTSWLQKMRPSYYRRKENTTSGHDTSSLMSISPPTNNDFSSMSGCSDHQPMAPRGSSPRSSPRYQRAKDMYRAVRMKDELTDELLTSNNTITTEYDNR